MLENMACSLIEHKRINTTVAKAKELRKFVEPIITRSKEDSTHNRREVFKNLQSKNAVTEVFREIAPKVAQREGGYTRIIKLGTRMGDSAEMAMIELVDFNELMLKDSNTKTRRSRRGGKKKETEATSEAPAVEETAKAEEPKADEAIVEAPPEDKEAKAEATIPEAKEESKAVEPKTDESKEEDKKD
jgi:large subunit ribosomal protein L17